MLCRRHKGSIHQWQNGDESINLGIICKSALFSNYHTMFYFPQFFRGSNLICYVIYDVKASRVLFEVHHLLLVVGMCSGWQEKLLGVCEIFFPLFHNN